MTAPIPGARGEATGRVDLLIPRPLRGSGGHRTIYSNARALAEAGFRVTLHVEDGVRNRRRALDRARKWFEAGEVELAIGWPRALEGRDILIATTWQSALFASQVETDATKAHFAQDYESLFYPMGDLHLGAIKAHDVGLETIVIGEWMRHKLLDAHGIKAFSVPFTANLARYAPPPMPRSERPGGRRVVAMYQPGKPRRCPELMVDALTRLLATDRAVEVVTVGSRWNPRLGSRHRHLGIVSPDELGDVYRRSDVGLSLSTSNPSRAPFEMMAAGLPVVELGLENNLYDLPETACLLSSADGASLSGAICELLADPGQSTPFSDAGVRFMSSRDEARENAAFVAAVRSILSGSRPDAPVPREINTREPFRDPEPSLLPVGRDVRFRDRVRRRLAR